MVKRARRDRVPYGLWSRQGFIEATPGSVVDYGAIEQRILADSSIFDIREIAYDPWNATHVALRLQAQAEQVLRETVRSSRAKAGTAIVLDPLTGAVLAMATAPRVSRSSRAIAARRDGGGVWPVIALVWA